MKVISKKGIAWVMIALLLVGIAGFTPCVQEAVVQAKESVEIPSYMAKLTGAWKWVYQSVKAEAEATYHFSCDYYVTESGNAQATIWRWSSQDSSGNESSKTMQAGMKGTINLSYTAQSIDNNVMVRLEGCSENTVFYVWNCCLTKGDSTENLLKNADFSEGGGSWMRWTIQTDTISEAVKSLAGQEIIAYDESLFPASDYMLELHGTHIDNQSIMHNYVNVYQQYTMNKGEKYTFRCNYYDRAADGNASILLFSDQSQELEGVDNLGRLRATTQNGKMGSLELSYTAVADGEILTVSVEASPDSVCYMWNFCLTKNDSIENLLKNAEFKEGPGSFIGWEIKNSIISTKAESDAMSETYGHRIVEYSESIIAMLRAEDVGKKTYEDPNIVFDVEDIHQYQNMDLNNPSYMLQLDRTHVEGAGAEDKWLWMTQGVTSTEGVTYVLQCDYYMPSDATENTCGVAIWSDTSPYNEYVESIRPGTKGTVELRYTANADDNKVYVRLECAHNVNCYFTNVTLTEEGSDTNLLRNGNFAESYGSMIGWSIENNYINDKAKSDTMTLEYGYAVLPCDWTFFSNELADWSIQPRLTDTLDFTYRVTINEHVEVTQSPNMLFSMYDGEKLIQSQTVNGDLGTDGRYYFHYPVLPQQMSYTLTATLKVLTAEGVLKQTKQYSVEDYCISILKNSACSAEVKTLVADMVQYGAQVQKQIGVRDTIAERLNTLTTNYGNTAQLSDIQKGIVSSIVEEQTNETYQWESASLILYGKTTLRLKFQAENIDGLIVIAYDTAYSKNGQHQIYQGVDGSYWYVDVPIPATKYGEVIQADFYSAAGEKLGKTLSYSVHTYLARMQDKATIKELLQAIYRYGQSSTDYATWQEEGNTDSALQNAQDSYLFTSEGNVSSRMNPQTGGADAEAKRLRESIMNATDTYTSTQGTIYYISEKHGNDANAGTSEENAWKTLAGYRSHLSQIKDGDVVLLERGGIYRGTVSDRTVFPLVSGVMYGAYGSGAKPAIYGSQKNYVGLGTWKKTDTENIWVCNDGITNDVGCIVFNCGQAVGVKRLKISDNLTYNLAELTDNFEFYHDLDTGKLYLYLKYNPALSFYDIEICENSYLLLGNVNSTNITIDNLSLKYSGGHAIRFHDGAKDINITNCEIGYIGGSLQKTTDDTRYGNGIEFWNGCSEITVENNWIYQIYDAGFTHQGADIDGGYTQENISVRENLIEYCSFALEFWVADAGTDCMKNICYEKNLLRFTGYGWGMVRPSIFGVAAVNTWGYSDKFETTNFVIQENVFDLSTRALFVAYYKAMPEIQYTGNTYYLKEGYVALWQSQKYLGADSQEVMEESVAQIDTNPKGVQYLGK